MPERFGKSCTPFQARLISAIMSAPNACDSATRLAHTLKTSRLAVARVGYLLEQRQVLVSFRHGTDQWAALYFGLHKTSQNYIGL